MGQTEYSTVLRKARRKSLDFTLFLQSHLRQELDAEGKTKKQITIHRTEITVYTPQKPKPKK